MVIEHYWGALRRLDGSPHVIIETWKLFLRKTDVSTLMFKNVIAILNVIIKHYHILKYKILAF